MPTPNQIEYEDQLHYMKSDKVISTLIDYQAAVLHRVSHQNMCDMLKFPGDFFFPLRFFFLFPFPF